jgi:hypothetical protein
MFSHLVDSFSYVLIWIAFEPLAGLGCAQISCLLHEVRDGCLYLSEGSVSKLISKEPNICVVDLL